MAFDIVPAVKGDAAKVADVHLNAMGDNALLHAQFPSPESLEFLRGWLENDTAQHVEDGSKGVLIAKDDRSKETASFVKWQVHGGKKASIDQPAQAEEWPDSCRTEYLDSYGELTARVRKEVMGDSPYYRMSQFTKYDSSSKATGPAGSGLTQPADVTFLCTEPNYANQGAASSLLRQVQERAAADGMAVVLESTMNAVTFYQRLRFGIARELDMMLPERGSDEPTELYEEKCMVWRPSDSVNQKGP